MTRILTEPPPSSESFGNVTNPAPSTNAGRETSLLSLEGIALQNGLIPLTLSRENCSPEAEQMVRNLGRVPRVSDPWLPLSTIGPLLVMAHHSPRATDFWGVPPAFIVKVLISNEQYQNTRKELVQRFGTNPIPAENTFEQLRTPKFSDLGLEGTFEWLLENFPYDNTESNVLRQFYQAAKEKKDTLETNDFNVVQRNLGAALEHLVSAGKRLVFNAKEAPRQNFFPLTLLERHNVYPIYAGKHVVYLLSENGDCYTFEDEWLSLGNDPVKIIPVLADGNAIREAINRAAAALGQSSAVSQVETANLSLAVESNLVDIQPEDMAAINPTNPNHEPEDLVKWALFTAIRCRASDLHIEKFYNLARFRARIDGNLKTLLTAPENLLNRFVALIKNYAGMGQSRQEAQDGRFAMAVGRRRVDVRVAAVPTRREFQKLIMRFLDKQDGVRRLSDFNLSQRQIDILGRTMQRDQGLVLVTGPTGSGKTTTCRHLVAGLHSGLYRVLYVSMTTGNVMDLYKSIAWELGLPTERNRASLFRQIRSEVSRLCAESRLRPVLIVDEAHHLRTELLEDLRLLTNYAMDSENRLTVVLVGHPELRRRMGMAALDALAQRIVVRAHVRGLARDEMGPYLAHRLRLAGTEVPLFEPPTVEAIFQASSGLPRKANALAHHALFAAAITKAKSVTTEHVQSAMQEVA